MADDVSLRGYVDAMFMEKEKALQAALLAQEKAVAAALESADKAITKAEANAEKWRENANEWRGAMSDRDRELPSRREVETAMSGLAERLAVLERFMTGQQGQRAAETRREDRIEPWQIWAAGVLLVAATYVVNHL